MLPIKITIEDAFFEEEDRCGYRVSRDMKKIWAVELDLLNEFSKACEKYQLKWFVHAGTMLGAIRHKGFIPWDDDIDVVMPRVDYEKFCGIASDVFMDPYFFQTEKTDRFFCRNFARLRNSKTTAIQHWESKRHYPYNQGIFIDIFPMDNIPDDLEERKQYFEDVMYNHSMSWQMRNYVYFFRQEEGIGAVKYLKRFGKHLIFKYIQRKKRNYVRYINKCDEELQKYNDRLTEWVGESVIPPLGRWVWKREWVSQVEWMPFEMIRVPVPTGYEGCLESGFGANWRTPIHAVTMHGAVFFDAEAPYTKYLKISKYNHKCTITE